MAVLARSKWTRWVYWGCAPGGDVTRARKVFQVNVAALVAFVSMVGFGALYATTTGTGFGASNLVQVPFYALVASVPFLNRRGAVNLARWVLSLSVTAALAATVWLSSGSFLDAHFYFVLFAMMPVAFFPLKEWPSIAALFALNLGLFVACEYDGVPPEPALLLLDPTLAALYRAGFATTSIATVLFITWLGEYAASRNERELEALSGIDPLTRLPNRRRLSQRLDEALRSSKRTGQAGAVLFADLDQFKPLNDRYGHDAGDVLLQEVGRRLQASLREVDVAARLGGDEFVVLLTDLGTDGPAAEAHARVVAEKLRAALSAPYQVTLPGSDVTVEHRCGASIGVACFRGGSHAADGVLQRADAAMYRAKANGRDRVEVSAEEPAQSLSAGPR